MEMYHTDVCDAQPATDQRLAASSTVSIAAHVVFAAAGALADALADAPAIIRVSAPVSGVAVF